MLILLCKKCQLLDATDVLKGWCVYCCLQQQIWKKKSYYMIAVHSGFCWHKVTNVAATHTDWVDSSKINHVTCFQYSTELFFLIFLFLKVNIILPSFTALIGLDEYHSRSSVGINCVWDWKHDCCYSQCSVRHLTDLRSWLPGWERDRSWALWILQQI